MNNYLNFFVNYIRRYRRSKKYKLTYESKSKNIQVWYCGLLMKPKLDYKFNNKNNVVTFSFMPQKGANVEIRGILKNEKI